MKFDSEGHLQVLPGEFESLLTGSLDHLICHLLLPGTPVVFETHLEYCQFRDSVADALSVHPMSVILRGSAMVGFSISPKSDKIWRPLSGESDIDLAIVDPDHYHFLDAEIRRWDRKQGRKNRRKFYGRLINLIKYRAHYCYRYMDLPDTTLVEKYKQAMIDASSALGGREVTAFFYRDWWALQSRYEFDLRKLRHDLSQNELPHAPIAD